MTEDTVPGTYEPPSKRRRTRTNGTGNMRMCPHCGRMFKRTEHLERHVRTHTKEKPFACHCGNSFGRRDLLVRHHRVSGHAGEAEPSPEDPSHDPAPGDIPLEEHGAAANDADLAAAVSLSGLSNEQWNIPSANHLNVPLVGGQQTQAQSFVNEPQYVPGILTPHMLEGGIDFDTHFNDFTSFLDGIGLSTNWSPFFGAFERNDAAIDPAITEDANNQAGGTRTRAGTPFSSWLPSAPTGNLISTNVPDHTNPRAVDPDTRPFKVTEDQRTVLKSTLANLTHLLDPSFCLPSRHALTRYLTSFFGGFHPHMPFIHEPTWQIEEHSAELILGMASIGAQYCFERKVSDRLFYAGKAVLMDRLKREAVTLETSAQSSIVMIGQATQSDHHVDENDNTSSVETVRALTTLMAFATWDPKPSMVQESFVLQGLLTHLLRDVGMQEMQPFHISAPRGASNGSPLEQDWHTWVDQESSRRSKLIAFSFLHTHSIAYNVYPPLRSSEVSLRLPSSTQEWKAPNAMAWYAATKDVHKPQLYFEEALSLLLKNLNESAPLDPIPTPLGNYVLLHGLLQRIHIVRDLSLPIMNRTAALPTEEVEKLERALRSWTCGWQQAPESSLDPNNENGPIPFTSSSLLALAYVRIYLHLGPYRQLETRDPQRIAVAIARSPEVERSDGIIAALLYATHMIGIPVRLGIDRVARSQAFFWSVRHSLSGLDCGVLLSKWLARLAVTMAISPLSESEDKILHWVRCIVEEAYTVVDFDEDSVNYLDFHSPADLCLAVLKIWAHFFKSNTQWPFINIMGESLERYRQMLIRKRINGT